MKTINNYLIERLKLNSDSKVNETIGFKKLIELLNIKDNPFGLVELNSDIKKYINYHWYHGFNNVYYFVIDKTWSKDGGSWLTMFIKESAFEKDHILITLARLNKKMRTKEVLNEFTTAKKPFKIRIQGKSGHDLSFIDLFIDMLEYFKSEHFDILEKIDEFKRYKKRFTNLGYININEINL